MSIPQYSEADTRAKLIDPAIHKRGWTEDFIRREGQGGQKRIINIKLNISSNLRTQAHRIIKRAGLKPWGKTFQNLR